MVTIEQKLDVFTALIRAQFGLKDEVSSPDAVMACDDQGKEERQQIFEALLHDALADRDNVVPGAILLPDAESDASLAFEAEMDVAFDDIETHMALEELKNACNDRSDAFACAMALWSGLSTLAKRAPAKSKNFDRLVETALQLCVESATDQTSVEAVVLCAALRGQGEAFRRIVEKFAA